MLLDAVSEVGTFVAVFIYVYILAVLAYILTLWVQLPYSLRPVQRFLNDACEPYLRLWRRILPFRVGAFDLSPTVAVLALIALNEILQAVLDRLH